MWSVTTFCCESNSLNNFAISSDGIAEGLSRSASTLVSAGNSLEESIAMLAAGNKVQQDPEGLGNALKVLSMRIRGTKTDLEEAGESTEGMIENTSKLRDKVMALTDVGDGGVDILTDSGAYKSTYQILLEIAEVWDKINEVDPKNQAALLEILAGKTRGSQVASILQNPEDLKDAYEMALNSDGSAQKELNTYLNSIQGRIDLFTNELQTFWMNLINSNVIKFAVDAGTTILELLNNIMDAIDKVAEGWGSLGVIIPAAIGALSLNNIKDKNNLGNIFEVFSFGAGKAKDKFKNSDIVKNIAQSYTSAITDAISKTSTKINAKDLLTELTWFDEAHGSLGYIAELIGYKDENTQITKQQTEAILKQLQVEGILNEEISETILNSQLFSTAQAGATASTLTFNGVLDMLKIKLAAAGKAFLAFLGTPLGMFAAVAAGLAAIAVVYDAVTTSHKEYVEQIEKSTQELEEIRSKIKSLNDELQTTQNRIDELNNKDSLSFAEQEELDRLKAQNAELERQIELQTILEQRKQKEQVETALAAIESDPNLTDQYVSSQANTNYGKNTVTDMTNVGNKWEQNLNALQSAKVEYDKAKAEYEQTVKASKTDENITDEDINKLKENLEKQKQILDDANAKLDKQKEEFDADYGDIGYFENATEDWQKEFNDAYRKIQDYVNKQAFINEDFGKSDIISSVFGVYATDAAKAFKEEFQKGIEKGGDPSQILKRLFQDSREYAYMLNEMSSSFGISNNDIIGFFTKTGEYAEQAEEKIAATVTSLDKLTSSVESYKSILQIVSEITYDGQAISEEYYNTLKEQLADVTYGTQDFSDAIDTENGYVVKNTSLLHKLALQSKNVTKATIQAAKAKAQLQYKELVSSIRKTVIYLGAEAQANEFVSRAVADNINAMRDQMETIKQTVQEYALLELSLSDAANAFDEYEKAKERDAKLTYDDSMLEMLKTIDEGLLRNETGTEAFEYAVKAIVPEKFWKDIDDVDEKIKSIHDYIDGDNVFSRFFYVDEESGNLDITTDNVREFVELCIDSGLFDGSSKDFALNNSVQGAKDFADALGVTEPVILAMLSALEDVDAKWSNILTEVTMTPFDRSINSVINNMGALNEQFADGSINAADYAQQMAIQEIELAELTKEARDGLLGSADEYNDALKRLNQIKEDAVSVGYDGTQSQFGNIDTNDANRILDWTEQSLEANKSALLSWERETNESINDAWARIKSEFEGSYSTVQGTWDTFDGVDIAFSPMLQTDSGPVYVNANTLYNYIHALVAKAQASGQEPTYDVLMKLDEQGLDGFEQSGYRIKGILADVGETASKTAEIMHFAGSTGAIADAESQLDYARGYIELQKQVVTAQADVDKSLQNLTEKHKAYNRAVESGLDGEDLAPYSDAINKANDEFNKHVDVLDEAIKKRDELSKYSGEYAIELVLSDVETEIEEIGSQFDSVLSAYFIEDSNGYWVVNTDIHAGVSIEDLEQKYPGIANYIALLNQQTELEALLDPTKAEESANALQQTVDGVIQAIENNLITLELDEKAVNNIVEQANKILDGITQHLGVTISAALPSWLKNVLNFLGIDVSNSKTTDITSDEESGAAGALGSAFASGNIGLKQSEHNAVVGELGREMIVDPYKGVYYTVGENGTEMVDLPKGAIIYNHKQTEELLKNGHTSRGKLTGGLSFAHGNAHGGFGIPSYHPNLEDPTSLNNYTSVNKDWMNATSTLLDSADALDDASDSIDDAADEFKETINWIEVLFTRIDNILAEHEAYFETIVDSTGGIAAKESVYNTMYGQMYNKASYSLKAAEYYGNLAETILSGMDAVIAEKVRNGTILIEEITDEALKENIDKALEYLDQKSQYTQQYYQTIVDIADKAKEHLDEVAKSYENEIGLTEHLNDMLEAHNDLLETKESFAAEAYYDAQINAQKILLKQYEAERQALQRVLDQEVAAGRVQVGSDQWFEMQQAIYDVDDAIIDAQASIEDLQNSINDLHWDRFDELINRFEYIEDEIGNVIQLLSHDPDGLILEELRDLTTDNWATGNGLATIGLYAQEMERAQHVANQYADAIKELKQDYAAGKYNETEYLSKLNELISAQYENIEKYYDARDAIVELNEARVDAIRDGIEKEIDAYQELIDKKKELLDKERDLHDFQNDIAEKEKEVSDIRKQLAAMAGDTTAATTAKRKQLEAELVEAQKALEESYYDHSMSARQEALDKEFSDFEEEKNEEIEKWEEWLTDVKTVVSQALEYVKSNTTTVLGTLTGLGEQYGLTMSDTLTNPWTTGQMAIDSYSDSFETAVSSFTSLLDGIVLHWQDVTAAAEAAARAQASALQAQYNSTANKVPSTIPTTPSYQQTVNNTTKPTTPTSTSKPTTTPQKAITVGGKINAGSATIYADSYGGGGGKQYYRNDPIYTVLQERNGYLLVRYHKLSSGYTGWFKKSDVKAYAKGLKKSGKDHVALLNELGPELQLAAGANGNLEYVKYGTSIIPADISAKLMNLALDPTSIFDEMKTDVKAPNIETKDFNYEFNFDSLLHVDNASNDSIPALQKMIRNEFNVMMKQVNNGLKRAGKS